MNVTLLLYTTIVILSTSQATGWARCLTGRATMWWWWVAGVFMGQRRCWRLAVSIVVAVALGELHGLTINWHCYSKRNMTLIWYFCFASVLSSGTQVEVGTAWGRERKCWGLQPTDGMRNMTKSPTLQATSPHDSKLIFLCLSPLACRIGSYLLFCTSMFSTIHPHHRPNQDYCPRV